MCCNSLTFRILYNDFNILKPGCRIIVIINTGSLNYKISILVKVCCVDFTVHVSGWTVTGSKLCILILVCCNFHFTSQLLTIR